ncbi:hypothetical protein ABXJ56_07315 [Microbacterium chocolatum]|uniref:hypothetical protein n=1 Tax=Microbacterium aurantiacum TaxID=162393 RepID=UPI00338FA870
MRWEMHLPGARAVWVLAPVAFGVFAVLTPLLPDRVGPDVVLAPAALLLWVVWVLWAYPEVMCRDGEFVVRNPFRTVRFTASSAVEVSGSGVPQFRHGSRAIRPVVMLVSPGGAMDTLRAGKGVTRGVNTVRMETLAPGHDVDEKRGGGALRTMMERAGDRPPGWVQTWNLPGFALTLALVAWAVSATLL